VTVKCRVCTLADARHPSSDDPICEGCHCSVERFLDQTSAQLDEGDRRDLAHIHFRMVRLRRRRVARQGMQGLSVYRPILKRAKAPSP